MRAAAGGGYSTATDLADWLVRALGMPFREAHHVTGRIVAAAEAKSVPLDKLPLEAMQAVEPRITGDVFSVLSVGELGQEPGQLWGNCATERAQNGASLAEAVGKGPRQGARTGRYRPRSASSAFAVRPDFRLLQTVEAGFEDMRVTLTAECDLACRARGCWAGALGLGGCGVRGSLDPPPPQGDGTAKIGRGRLAPPGRRPPKPHERLHPRSADPLRIGLNPPCTTSTTRTASSTPRTSSLARIAAEVGTPFYCYSTATLERHYRVLTEAFAGQDALICYAVKANSNQAVLRTLARLGAGMDVVSEGELRRALAAGVPADKIIFAGVGKTREEMAYALEQGILGFNVESEPELDALSEVAAGLGRTAHIALRVNPDVDAKTHAKISTGKAENKFGMPFERGARGSTPRPPSCRASPSPASTCTSAARSPIWSRSATPSG